MTFQAMADIIPEGRIGDAEIKHVAGVCKLFVDAELDGQETNEVVMSDMQIEYDTNQVLDAVTPSTNKVLIAGLGIGFIVLPLLDMAQIDEITVVEKNQNIIDLVEPHITDAKLTVINADIFDWEPPQNYDFIYFDIWTHVEQSEVDTLNDKYSPNLNADGYIGHWMYSGPGGGVGYDPETMNELPE